ncbi:ABC transporter permease [Actinomadura sp. WAC 06369]|uniref:ABC transporter permease n=1 Tax=Actinomadura sp. WAC 06369 TaxID=2203193 RepID=UPI000F7AD382|nr:FtsX-like permease family protein [Actinomadura sp. WAC 06369]RSN54665.1 ABC transporter permease [Actinomadura sp. WAC 06369]
MTALALRSLRKRTGAFTASFLALFLGATILMAFASMLDTASGTSGAAHETLVTMASVVGGWGLLLVVFAVTSTLTLSVRQRSAEMALLKSVGATPAQLTRMITGEAAVLAVVASLLAVGPAVLAGRALLGLLHDTGQVPGSVPHAFGPVAVSMGVGITFVSAVGAALLTARRLARGRIADTLAETDSGRLTRKRAAFAWFFFAVALGEAVVTVTVMRDEGSNAMATSGQADIFAALGLALLAPAIVRRAASVLAGPLRRFGGVAGDLAVTGMLRRTGATAAAVTPVILFTGIAVGTLYMQSTENSAAAAAGIVKTSEDRNIETLNFVVIGMVVLFTAIMLVNTLVAATAHRRREFGQTRLAGATPRQVMGTVAVESALLTVIGVVCGSAASLFTIVPFSLVRVDSPVPEGGVWTYVGVVALAAVLTGATAALSTRRVLRAPAIEAVSA